MDVNEILEGETLTGKQAIIIFFGFLLLVISAGVLLVLLSDVFRALI
ncbi:hypothetical protein [Natronorubrum sulfidifaciens]|uniref:Uncharacterized protein n=1 Tax=Natronorubrum sulfidifaciens JCM 14089 TaxID=1230460 RepID=L9W5W6_9EURY|nr:hypothetical protein [Natronorubrum sulfidifaciens]ELY44661.1 hypothetical protein C495_09774 [Natronorubrum sulfidifaciens JCM 14089]